MGRSKADGKEGTKRAHCTVQRGRVRWVESEGELRSITDSDVEELAPGGSVVYWMSRDQRVEDNWALLFANELSQAPRELAVVFNLQPRFLEATERQYSFMLQGLEETEVTLRSKGIPFYLLQGQVEDTLPRFLKSQGATALVTDFSPLRTHRQWSKEIRKKLGSEISMFTVDAHNVVPVWETSPKQEYAARTIRPKITKMAPTYLVDFPLLERDPSETPLPPITDWKAANQVLEIDRTVPALEWLKPGTKEGLKTVKRFCEERLQKYDTLRNKPNEQNVLSNLSPYFHFGQIAPQRAILEVQSYAKKNQACQKSAEGFVEETLVRRELSDNFCFYQENYDRIEGASDWAQLTLSLHANDKRDYVYTQEQFDGAKTHSAFWNAMQTQLVVEGKLHGFCRMQWAKNILEWAESPSEALRIAIYLNDRYNLDGRDPNGYVGCMWAICGLHDQGWRERQVTGKIRYMNEAGCRRKFDVASYIKRYQGKHPELASKRPLASITEPPAKRHRSSAKE